MISKTVIVFATIIFSTHLIRQTETCNEMVCGSVVTKCLLVEACSCKLDDCTCCKDCFTCLGKVFDECCSCIDLCPSPTNSWTNLSKTSYVEEFDEKLPLLFVALTDMPDPIERWTVVTFPVEIDSSLFAPKIDFPLQLQVGNDTVPVNSHMQTVNCTVVYMSTCRSMDKCKSSCKSMGATSIRWFHDGCCECVGDTCINYGLNQSQCRKCKEGMDTEEEEDDYGETTEDDLDFGESLDEEYDEEEYVD